MDVDTDVYLISAWWLGDVAQDFRCFLHPQRAPVPDAVEMDSPEAVRQIQQAVHVQRKMTLERTRKEVPEKKMNKCTQPG